MSNIGSYTSKEIIRVLVSKGFVLDRQKSSHALYMMPDGTKRVIVPMHNKDLPKGTFFSILKQAGIDKGEL